MSKHSDAWTGVKFSGLPVEYHWHAWRIRRVGFRMPSGAEHPMYAVSHYHAGRWQILAWRSLLRDAKAWARTHEAGDV